MCAIVDASVAHQVFGENRPPAGQRFFEWLSSRRGQLVVGGRLLEELSGNVGLLQWLKSASLYGRARSVIDESVNDRAEALRRSNICTSNDEHVIALALVSGARLLYTNDQALINDFKNQDIIAGPRGKIYTTAARDGEITDAHRRLLAARDLCRAPRT